MASPALLRTPSNDVLQQEFLERSLSSMFLNSKHLCTDFKKEQISLQKTLENQRKEELKIFLQTLNGVMTLIKTLKEDIFNEENIFKKDMSYFEGSFRNIKDTLATLKLEIKDKAAALQVEEEQLQILISTLGQRINPPTDPVSKTSSVLPIPVGPQVSSKSAYDNMHPDIQEFQNFLQKTGGHFGGWTSADHLLFCKLLQKRKGSTDFVSAVLEQMPDKSGEDVNAHEAWYHQYLTLKQAHRQALSEWKKTRDVCVTEKNQEGVPTSQSDLPRIMIDTNRSQEVKSRIAEWRRKQDEKRREEMEKLLMQKKQEEEKWKRKMAYFERQRTLLLQRKMVKEAVKLSKHSEDGPLCRELKEVEHLEKMLDCSRLTLKDFREFDDEFLKRRLSRLERHRRKSIDNLRDRSSSLSTMAKRDPSRLLQPTAVWKIRVNRSKSECKDAERQRTNQFFINNIPHLGVPDWRKGIAL